MNSRGTIDTDALRDALPVADYAERLGVELHRSGKELRGACPICGGTSRRPFSVDGERWICHSCQASGDVIALCQQVQRVDFRQAARQLAELAGVDTSIAPDAAASTEAAHRARQAAESRQQQADLWRHNAEKRARRIWEQLARTSPAGLDYLRRRGVEAATRDVRFSRHAVCVPLRQLDGSISNVIFRDIRDHEHESDAQSNSENKRGETRQERRKLNSLKGCGTLGTFGDVRRLASTAGPIVIVEGVFDWLTARVLAPDRLVLGAHGAGRISAIVRLILEQHGAVVRERGLVFVPHRDDNRVGQRQVDKAIAAARELGVPPGQIRIFPVGRQCGDLNDYFLAAGPAAARLDDAPSLAEQDRDRFALTDLGNAKRFAHLHREHFRYVPETGHWYGWDGKTWALAHPDGELVRGVEDVIDDLEREANIARIQDPALADAIDKHAHKTQGHNRIAAVIALARSRKQLTATLTALDRDPFLLAVENGTIDLRTGKLHPHRRDDLITSRSPIPYDPNAKSPRWERFLAEVFEPNPDAAVFVQRYAGYSLTGDISAQCLLFAHGTGENGKGVLFRRIEHILGPGLAVPSPFDAFIQKHSGDAPLQALAEFRGKRAVFVSEGNQGARLAEGLVKQITGGDRIAARFLYGQLFHYTPRFKLWMSSNHLPQIRGTDHGIWRRFKLVPFEVTFEATRDDDLERDLDADLPAILAWAVRGCLDWQRSGGGLRGLGNSASIAEATDTYRTESDHIGRFLGECCVTNIEGAQTRTTTLYTAYRGWTENEGTRPLSNAQFGREMRQRGLGAERGHRAKFYPVGLPREGDSA